MADKKDFNSGQYSGWQDPTDALANELGQIIELYHVPTEQSVKFKAYLTAFTDQYSCDWSSEEVFGRMDPIQTYKSTKRTISLGWDVPASSFFEAKTNLQKASKLLSLLYPTYSKAGGGASTMTAPPLFKLKFMNLIQDSQLGGAKSPASISGLLGTIAGFTYEPDLESGFFQPTKNTKNGPYAQPKADAQGNRPDPKVFVVNKYVDDADRGKLFPQTIKFQCEYTVLHQHSLGWNDAKAKEAVIGFGKFPYDSQHDFDSTQEKIKSGSPGLSEDQLLLGNNLQRLIQQRNAALIGGVFDPVTRMPKKES